MTRALDPMEKVASRKESELDGDGLEYTLIVAEERRDPREYPDSGDWLEESGVRWLVIGPGPSKVTLERLSHTRRGQHRFLNLTLRAYQMRFAGAEVLGKKTNYITRREIAKKRREQKCHLEGDAR